MRTGLRAAHEIKLAQGYMALPHDRDKLILL
jgi:hypothetical protein